MNSIKEAQALLQRAYDTDVGQVEGVLDIHDLVDRIGALIIHHVYYGPVSGLQGIQEHLAAYPDGILATVLRVTRDVMVSSGEYTAEGLNQMYGLLK